MSHLGAGAERAGGARGVEFPGCPAWWTRSPAEHPGKAHGIGLRGVHAHVSEQRWWLEHGGLGPPGDLPGRLHDCLLALAGEEARRDAATARASERAAKLAKLRGGRA